MLRADQFRLAGRGDQDVRLAADGRQVGGPGVRDGDRGVPGQQQQRGWLAHHGGPADHDRPAAAQRDPLMLEGDQHRRCGGRGEEAGEPGRQPAQRRRVRPIDVLGGRDRRAHAERGHARGQGGLADDAVHRRSRDSSARRRGDLLRSGGPVHAGGPVHPVHLAGDAGPGGGPLDGPHIPGRARVVRGDQHGQGGGDPAATQHVGLGRGRGSHRHRDRPAVHEVGHLRLLGEVKEVGHG